MRLMNYIELINQFWKIDDGTQFSGWESKLYFYLLKTANGLGWVAEFWHSDAKTAGNVGLSINSLKTARTRLQEAGLISFSAGGKGFGDKTRYQILTPKLEPKVQPKLENATFADVDNYVDNQVGDKTRYQNLTPKPQPKVQPKLEPKSIRYQNLTPKLEPKVQPINKQRQKLNFNSPTTEEEDSFFKKNELPEFVENSRQQAAAIAKNRITVQSLTEKILANEKCQAAAKNAKVPAIQFPDAVQMFVSDKFGIEENEKWKDMSDALLHFISWVKFYNDLNTSKYAKRNPKATTGRDIVERHAEDNSALEQGDDGVLRRVSGKGVRTFAG